jgi:hypothetical protein
MPYSTTSQYQQHQHNQHNLFPVGLLPMKLWLIVTVALAIVVVGIAVWMPAFATDPHSQLAQLYKRALAWGAIGDNAPLSHFPLATSLGYLSAVSLGVLSGLCLLITRLKINTQWLANWWKTDHTILFILLSLAGAALIFGVFLSIPFTHGHFLSLRFHSQGMMHQMLMSSLHSRWMLALICLGLYIISVLITAIMVLGPCLNHRASQVSHHD